jgi:hypothetical protein
MSFYAFYGLKKLCVLTYMPYMPYMVQLVLKCPLMVLNKNLCLVKNSSLC